jgi:hypothetical protein
MRKVNPHFRRSRNPRLQRHSKGTTLLSPSSSALVPTSTGTRFDVMSLRYFAKAKLAKPGLVVMYALLSFLVH